MPTAEEIRTLVESMPELDNPPPPPPKPKPEPEKKPAEVAKPAEGSKPVEGAKPTESPKPVEAPKPPPPDPKLKREKGKLHGPAWADAEKVYDQILAGGADAVGVVIDMVKENDIGPAYKARYVVHALATYTARPGKEKGQAAVVEALISRLSSERPKAVRGFVVRTLQNCADKSTTPALVPLLAEEDLADAAAQAMATLGGADAGPLLAKALPQAAGRAKVAIIQALGQVKDTSATEALTKAAADPDEAVRLTAVWALARGGEPAAIDPVLTAADATEAWPRGQATRAAFVLAESLAASGRKDQAATIYKRLLHARTGPHDEHVHAAAEQALAALK